MRLTPEVVLAALVRKFLDEVGVCLHWRPAVQDGMVVTAQRQTLMVAGLPLVCVEDLIVLQLASLRRSRPLCQCTVQVIKLCCLCMYSAAAGPIQDRHSLSIITRLQSCLVEATAQILFSIAFRGFAPHIFASCTGLNRESETGYQAQKDPTFRTQGGSGMSQLPSPTFPPPA